MILVIKKHDLFSSAVFYSNMEISEYYMQKGL